jgi:hypothetical protein
MPKKNPPPPSLKPWDTEFRQLSAAKLNPDQITERPTLFLGLGGTGAYACATVRRKFLEHFEGSIPQCFQFRAFDTDRNMMFAELEEDLHEKYITVFDPTEAARQLRSEGHTWIPDGFNADRMISGAGGVRLKGRIAFFSNADRILNFIEKALRDARSHARLGPNYRPEDLKAFIFCSIAGGTGSGSLLDLAFLLRQMSANLFITAYVGLYGPFDLSLPESQRLTAAAGVAAALKEIESFMRGDAKIPSGLTEEGQIRYSNTARGKPTIPFDVCHLIEETNNRGITLLTQPWHLAELMASSAFLEVCSPESGGQTRASTFDNVGQVLDQYDREGHLTCFSTMGLAHLHYDRNLCGHAIAARACAALVDHYLDDAADATDDLVGIDALLAIDTGTLRSDLTFVKNVEIKAEQRTVAEHAQPISYAKTVKDLAERITRPESRKKLPGLADDARKNSASGVGQVASRNRKTMLDTRVQEIDRYVRQILAGSGAGPLKRALDVLTEVRRRVATQLGKTLDSVTTERQKLRSADEALARAQEEIADAVSTTGLRDRLDDMMKKEARVLTYVQALNDTARASHELAVHEGIRDVLEGLQQAVSTLEQTLHERLETPLRGARDLLVQKAEERFTRIDELYEKPNNEPGRFLHVHVMSREAVEKILAGATTLGPVALASQLSSGTLSGLSGLMDEMGSRSSTILRSAADMSPPERMAATLYEALRPTMERYVPDRISQALEQSGENANEIPPRLRDLFERFAAAQIEIQAHDTAVGQPHEEIAGINGLERLAADKLQTVLNATRAAVMGVRSHQAVDVYRTFHGLSLRSMTQLGRRYQTRYSEYLSQSRKLQDGDKRIAQIHVFEGSLDWPNPWSSLRTESDEQLDVFAKLWAFGRIFPPTQEQKALLSTATLKEPRNFVFLVGRDRFYLQPYYLADGKPAEEPLALGSGVAEALQTARKHRSFKDWGNRWIQYAEEQQQKLFSNAEFAQSLDAVVKGTRERLQEAMQNGQEEQARILRGVIATLRNYAAEFTKES